MLRASSKSFDVTFLQPLAVLSIKAFHAMRINADGTIEDKDRDISLPTALEAQEILSH
jgi:hypothetical protein